VDGLACGLILYQPVLSSTLPFSGGIRLKNVSRSTIYIETPKLRGTPDSPVSLEWEGRLLACSILMDGLESYPYDIIELKPGKTVLLEYSWKRNPALEDDEKYFWPEPGHHAIKALLVFPEPAGDIMNLPLYNAGGRLFHGTIASNEVYVEVE